MNLPDLQVPDFASREAKHAFLGEMFAGERKFLTDGGMGIDFTNEIFVTKMLRLKYIGVLSGACPGYRVMKNDLSGMTMEERRKLLMQASINELKRQIEYVRERCKYGILGLNVMNLLGNYSAMVDVAGESGEVDILFPGAGIPTDLPRTMQRFRHMHYMPIIFSPVIARQMEKSTKETEGGIPPDGYYVEDPSEAGGHLAGKTVEKANDKKQNNPFKVREELRERFPGRPAILAGGIGYLDQIMKAFEMGYQGVSAGTRLLITDESGLPNSIAADVYLNENYPVVTDMCSPTGFPSRRIIVPEEEKSREEAIASIKSAMRECVNCIGIDQCKLFTEREWEEKILHYCIIRDLAKTRFGERGGIYFTGRQIADFRRNDRDLYYVDGKPRIPKLAQAIEYMLTHNSMSA